MKLKSSAKLQYVKWGIPVFLLLFCMSAIFPAQLLCDGLDTWTTRTSGTSNHLYGVTYGNSTFVAVGLRGKIVTSPDGVTWKTRKSGVPDDYDALNGVTFGNSTFVAVGDNGAIIQSGTTATTEPTPRRHQNARPLQ